MVDRFQHTYCAFKFMKNQAKLGAAPAPAVAATPATANAVSTPFDNYKFKPIREATVMDDSISRDYIEFLLMFLLP